MTAAQYHAGQFPPGELDWPRLIPLIGPANAAVAKYAGTLNGIPNAQVLLSPMTSQEAVLSSKIEGTQATLGEVLEFEAGQEAASDEKRDDILEVLNYRRAMKHAVNSMKELPLSQRLIRGAHAVLMDGVRGEHKRPGEYKLFANYIGPMGRPVEDARFIPAAPEQVVDLMSAWEKYLHSDAPDQLVQLAILHAEFEAIHPFEDGNGRIGRLLVPLFMVDKGLLDSPDFYLSSYLEARREEYYDRLLAVSAEGDWTGWCEFFLRAIIEQARDNESKARAILELYQSKKDWIATKTRSQYAIRALDWFFDRPIFVTSDFFKSADIPKPTAGRIVRIVRDEGLLKELRPSRGSRAATLCFPELLNITEGREFF